MTVLNCLFIFAICVLNINCATIPASSISNEIKQWMDTSVNPCDNFYNFVCGSYTNVFNKTDETSRNIDFFARHVIASELKVKNMLESTTVDMRLKNYYDDCMDIKKLNDIGLDDINNLLKGIGWPVTLNDKWNSDDILTHTKFGKMIQIGFNVNSMFHLNIEKHLKLNKYILKIDTPSLGIFESTLREGTDAQVLSKYYNYMVKVAQLFGSENINAETDMTDVLTLEKKLANICSPNLKANTTITTIKDLHEKIAVINWLDVVNQILPKSNQIDENEKVLANVYCLTNLVQTYEATPKKVMFNYIIWQAVQPLMFTLNDAARNIENEFLLDTHHIETLIDNRQKTCKDNAIAKLPLMAASSYVKKYFSLEAKQNVEEIIDTMKNQFVKSLSDITGMDKESKDIAINRIKSLKRHVGFPEELLNEQILEDYYKNLTIGKGKFLQAELTILKFNRDLEFAKLGKPINKSNWLRYGNNAADFNPEFDRVENTIIYPAGLLHGQLYEFDKPMSMNFASLGLITGYQLFRSLNIQTWTKDAKEILQNNANCMKEQYQEYLKQLTVNDTDRYSRGDISDANAGIRISYQAYKAWTAQHGPEAPLPGLDSYTPVQLFWIASGQMTCSSSGLARYRWFADGAAANNLQFAEDFGCPIGAGWKVGKKCGVWWEEVSGE